MTHLVLVVMIAYQLGMILVMTASKLRDVLELIAKRLDNLKNKRYLPSPEFEHMVKVNANKEVSSATLAATRAAASADTESKAAIAATTACNSAISKNKRLTAIQRESSRKPTASGLHTASRDNIPQAVHMTATCPASPKRIRSYYDVRSSGQNHNISVPSCVATTKIQSTNYPTTPISWLRQPSFDDHFNVSYIKKSNLACTIL